MSPTYTMSAHLCKQITTSWRQARQGPLPEPSNATTSPMLPSRRSPSPEKRSMDSDRSDSSPSSPMSRSSSASSWRWGNR
ncbi:hypothetical protein PG995_002110 [Apiospora arundinis]